MDIQKIRLLIVQFGGDYREAYERLSNSGTETYYAQKYSINLMGEIGREVEQLGVLCCRSEERFDEVVGNGVRAMGAAMSDWSDTAPVVATIEQFRPSHLVVMTPNLVLLDWAMSHGDAVLPMFADTFTISVSGRSWLRRLARRWRLQGEHRRLAAVLNDPRIRWIGNHNINASRALAELGVQAEKIVPWDWPPMYRPDDFAPKTHPGADRPRRLVFVGAVSESKGVGDAIDAIAELRRRGLDVGLSVVGQGDLPAFIQRADSLGCGDHVRFEGRQPHTHVIEAMRSADLVLVPSRHEYPEGLPMVIYEAFAVRTPLISSDHPAFRGRIGEGQASLTFPERRPQALADVVERVLGNPALYESMSRATAATWEQLQWPVKYGDLIRRWLSGGAEDDRWLAQHSVASVAAHAVGA